MLHFTDESASEECQSPTKKDKPDLSARKTPEQKVSYYRAKPAIFSSFGLNTIQLYFMHNDKVVDTVRYCLLKRKGIFIMSKLVMSW